MASVVESSHSYSPLRKSSETPQQAVDRHWRQFTSRKRGKPLTVLPQNDLAERVWQSQPKDGIVIERATASYDSAVARCKAKVASIVKECRRINQKYRDAHFDLEDRRMCLRTLTGPDELNPRSIFRIGDIFADPKFFIDGVSANDVRQGRSGDCWFLAAVAAISCMKDLVEKSCVARDEEVGVYGFVFHRDGEWISEIIDDKLYLTKPNYNDPSEDRALFDESTPGGLSEEKYRKAFLTGSDALFFAQCREENETWLPLLEKAFAKAHGDYQAIEGGHSGEAIEDMTGGITSEIRTTDILDKQKFWDELQQCNRQFIFGCWTGSYYGGGDVTRGGIGVREGIIEGHAYSVLRAVEHAGERLVMLHNPWGNSEWSGPWSDGSKEWTPAWMERLDHKFGDDGVFWMSYADLLRHFEIFNRTRLFGPDWTCTQVWASLTVPWKICYHDTKFCFTLDRSGLTVIALSQLDGRYFRDLEGQYTFTLQFRLQKDDEDDFVVRSHTNYRMQRSVCTELHLEAGSYTVYVKIVARRWDGLLPIEEVVGRASKDDREKLMQVGMKYDLAHTKREIRETEDERKIKAKEDKEKSRRAKAAEKKRARKLKAKQRREAERQKKAKARAERKAAATESKQDAATTTEARKPETEGTNGEATPSPGGKGVNGDTNAMKTEEDLPIRSQNPAKEEGTKAESRPTGEAAKPESLPSKEEGAKHEPQPTGEAAKPESLPSKEEGAKHEPQPNKEGKIEPEPQPSAKETKPAPQLTDDESESDSESDSDLSTTEPDDDDDDDEEDETDKTGPWNAVAVVGLRVFTRAAKVDLKVVTPKDADEPNVDVDDSAADAQTEAGTTNRQAKA